MVFITDYGNEKEAGEGVKRAIQEGIVKREELFLVSKLWGSFHGDHVEEACKKSLDLWGLDYFDLYIVHFPLPLKYVDPKVRYPPGWTDAEDKCSPAPIPLYKTWGEMEKLVSKGMAKSIGISNYNAGLVWDILRYAKIPPATLQIEHHPYLTQEPLIKLCQSHDIVVTAYSSFGPMSYVEMGVDAQKAKETPPLLEHDLIKGIASKHGKTPAQVLLRWATQRNVAVIPKSNSKDRLLQNLDVCSFDLSGDELKQISALNKDIRFNDPVKVSAKSGVRQLDEPCSLTSNGFVSSHMIIQYGFPLPIFN